MSYRDKEVARIGQVPVVHHDHAEKLNARTFKCLLIWWLRSTRSVTILRLLTGTGRFFSSAGMDFDNEPKLAYEAFPSDGDAVRTFRAGLPGRDPDDMRTYLLSPTVETLNTCLVWTKIRATVHFDTRRMRSLGPALGAIPLPLG